MMGAGLGEGRRKPQMVRPAKGPEKEEENVVAGVSESGGPGALDMMETSCTSVQRESRMLRQWNAQDLDARMPALAPSRFLIIDLSGYS